jgi:hypothetical protein
MRRLIYGDEWATVLPPNLYVVTPYRANKSLLTVQ